MTKKTIFWVHRFVFFYGLIMLSTFFMCLLVNPASELPVVPFFGRCIVLTLASMATLVVYRSKEELSSREWWVRTVLHTLFLEAVLLPLAHHWKFWYTVLEDFPLFCPKCHYECIVCFRDGKMEEVALI